MPSGRDAAGAGLTLAAALLLTACGGSGTDKAGGSEETPVVLTLANTDSDPTNVDSPDFVEAVEELSGRSVRIRVEFGWRAGAPFDRVDALTIQDVRDGRVDLAVVPARSWDLVGVKSFQALVAPFLVNSVALERSVLASPLVDRMLAGVTGAGVVGLAVLPGALRYPLGLTRRLAAPADYRGAVVGIRPSGVAAATVEALGARSEVYPPGQVVGLDGAELDLVTIRFNGYQHSATAMTGNAVLWPRAMTVVMNRDAFARLGQAQQDALRRAGVRALEPLLRRIETDEQAFLCDEGGLTLATASAHELGALRLAVRPVYAWLERDGVTKDLIAEIRRLRSEVPATATRQPSCLRERPLAQHGAAALEGVWRSPATRADLMATNVPEAEKAPVRRFARLPRLTLHLEDDRWVGRAAGEAGIVFSGRYTVKGDVVRFDLQECTSPGLCVRDSTTYAWSVYRNTLRFGRIGNDRAWPGMIAKPWTRVR